MILVVLDGPGAGSRFELGAGEHVMGREPSCPVHLPSRRVSRKHATITVHGDTVVVRDLGSVNGTLVNGHRMEACSLIPGTQIQVGDVLLVFEGPPIDSDGDLGRPTAVSEESLDDSRPTTLGDGPPPFAAAGFTQPGTEGFGGAAGAAEQPFGAPAGGFGGAPAGAGFGAPPAADPLPNELAATLDKEPAPFGGPAPASGFGGPAESAPFGAPVDGGFGAAPFGQPAAYADPGAPPPFNPGVDLEIAGGEMEQTASGRMHAAPAGPGGAVQKAKDPSGLGLGPRIVGVLFFVGLLLLCGPLGSVRALLSAGSSGMEEIAAQRGEAIAMSLAVANSTEMAGTQRLNLSVSGVSEMEGVREAILYDSRGNPVAPAQKLSSTSLQSSELFESVRDKTQPVSGPVGGGQYEVIAPIRAVVVDGQPKSVVGYAYLVYDAEGVADAAGRPWLYGIFSLLYLVFSAALVGTVVWRSANGPVEALREETELAMKGDAPHVHAAIKWPALQELAHSINRALGRSPASTSSPASEPELRYVTDQRLDTLLGACVFPVVVVDANMCVTDANDWGFHFLRVAREGAIGRPLMELVQDPAVSDTLGAMVQGVTSGQAPVLADSVEIDGEVRQLTFGATLDGTPQGHGVLVVL